MRRMRGRRRRALNAKLTIAALFIVLVVLANVFVDDDSTEPSATEPADSTPGTAAQAPPATASPTTAMPPIGGVLEKLAALRVGIPTTEVDGSYERELFGDGWAYDGTSGCSTRELVLIAESETPPAMGPRCAPLSGQWRSVYDNLTLTSPGQIQIDHLVPLADAWKSGAWQWTPERRHQFANDMTSPDTLIAVSNNSNQSKSDHTPDEWLPPHEDSWCSYTAQWVNVKYRWELSITPTEQAALNRVLSGC